MGLERPGDAPHLLPPPPERGAARCAALRDRSAAHELRAVGRPVARARRRLRRRALEHDGARDHPRRAPQRAVRRAGDRGVRGVRGLGRAVHARGGRAADRRARRRDPRDGARLRARRPGDDLLDARDHRAPQRRRQRPRADQPRPAVRPRRPLRLRPQPAARPEQRPGRRRHGRDPEQAAGLPGPRARRRSARPVRGRVGHPDPGRSTAGT